MKYMKAFKEKWDNAKEKLHNAGISIIDTLYVIKSMPKVKEMALEAAEEGQWLKQLNLIKLVDEESDFYKAHKNDSNIEERSKIRSSLVDYFYDVYNCRMYKKFAT